jgi:FkbM family methyltransferase
VRHWALALLPQRYHIPARYYYRRFFGTADPELRLLKTLVRPGSTTIDVGANLGVYTYALWKLSGRVEAFDPLPEYAELIRAFGKGNIGVHQVALSSQAGVQKLHLMGDGAEIDMGRSSLSPLTAGIQTVETEVRTLDQFGFTDVSFIKIDVEGHELEVLKGAVHTLTEQKPNLLVEIEQRHLSYPMSVVFEYLAGLGYRGSFLERRQLQPINSFSREQHQVMENLYSPDYVNNFLFER